MSKIVSHRDLVVWQRGMDSVEQAYGLTRHFPDEERFRLISQATRAAVAVPANLAEGHARGTRRDYAQFVAISRGSLMELETYVMISKRLRYVNEAQAKPIMELISELSRMLTALRSRLVEPRT